MGQIVRLKRNADDRSMVEVSTLFRGGRICWVLLSSEGISDLLGPVVEKEFSDIGKGEYIDIEVNATIKERA